MCPYLLVRPTRVLLAQHRRLQAPRAVPHRVGGLELLTWRQRLPTHDVIVGLGGRRVKATTTTAQDAAGPALA
jgi:hypothetical protein